MSGPACRQQRSEASGGFGSEARSRDTCPWNGTTASEQGNEEPEEGVDFQSYGDDSERENRFIRKLDSQLEEQDKRS